MDETLRLQNENESLKKEIQRLKQEIKALENEKHRYFVDFMDLENEVKGLKLFAFEKLKKDVFGT
ncbi:hypothetical protein NST81_02790 [Bacillus sp. FSL W8-0223]|uniref:hypothetical protein n=1 Tax=Bacillus sp. FSL W8-0223 TaxID=2954595 RepID=UPI0030F7D385